MARGRKMEWNINKIEEEENRQSEQRKKYSEEQDKSFNLSVQY